MEVKTEMKGTVVKNDANELAKTLDMDYAAHAGNYIFKGCAGSVTLTINTEPADKDEETIRIISIMAEPHEQRTLEITYRLKSAEGCNERTVEFPITNRNYEILIREVPEEKEQKERIKMWIELALQGLVKLQGYETLGSYTIALKLKIG